jgi:hypothetical protein
MLKRMYLVYADDSASGNDLQLVTAVMVNASDWTTMESLAGMIIDGVPDELRESFEFHASDLLQGRPPFDKLKPDEALKLIQDLVDYMGALGSIYVVYGAVDRRKLSQSLYHSADSRIMAFELCLLSVEEQLQAVDGDNLQDTIALLIMDDTTDKSLKNSLHSSYRQFRSLLTVADDSGPNTLRLLIAGTLQNSKNNRLAFVIGGDSRSRASILVHIACLAADEGLIHFDLTTQGASSEIVLHGKTNTVKHEPCGLLGNANRASQFMRTDPVTRVCNQPNCGKPLIQANRGVFKKSPGLKRKLLPALRALPDFAGLQKHRGLRSTVNTCRTFRPSGVRRFEKRDIQIAVGLDRFQESFRSAFHV